MKHFLECFYGATQETQVKMWLHLISGIEKLQEIAYEIDKTEEEIPNFRNAGDWQGMQNKVLQVQRLRKQEKGLIAGLLEFFLEPNKEMKHGQRI